MTHSPRPSIPRGAIGRRAAVLLAAVVSLAGTRPAAAQLRVVTSTTDLYDIARAVGGDRIVATHIGEGYQDPHFIEAKPSFVLQLQKADVWAFVGLDLEIGWMSLLLDGARNPRIRLGGSGYLDVSRAIPVLDQARGTVDRSQGDVHPQGNPHYWLDPENGRKIAALFRGTFSALAPKDAATFQSNEKAFDDKLNAAERTGRETSPRSRASPSSPGIRAGATSPSIRGWTSSASWSPSRASRRRRRTWRGSSRP
ncbi:MAG: zinc ABC transporter substrate-binding protein [Gemmatimonadetes bacterium]|nr:zinc ABC transporter substrate-binding protein [Gemmatimonadota bacterium]